MKKAIIFAVAVICMTSCSTIRKTSTTMDVATSLNSKNNADLIVSSQKVTLENYIPSKKEKRGGKKNVLNCAVAELLKRNGNADVLVSPQFETVERGTNVKRVTVSGYPATYKNFK